MEKKEIVVDVNHVTIRFNLANQKVDNLKEYFIKIVRHELMFQEFLAVKDVSFQIYRGEAWGLVGSNEMCIRDRRMAVLCYFAGCGYW